MAHLGCSTPSWPETEMLVQKLAPALPGRDLTVERFQTSPKDGIGFGFRVRLRDPGSQPAEYLEPHRLARRCIVQPILSGYDAGLHTQGEPEVRLLPAGFSDKTARRHTDDSQHSFAQREGPAQHVGTAAEPALPVAIANDGVERLGAVLV